MAAKSDGVLKMKKSDVAFTPLQNSDHSGSVQGLVPGSQPDSGIGDGDFVNGESRCCGSKSTCLRLGREQQTKYTIWDCLWILAAVVVYFADVGTDIWLSVDYYLRREYWWFGLTLFFVVLGSFSVQVFSFRWFVHDFSTDESANAAGAANCSSHMDGKLLTGSASHGDVGAQPSTPQKQASTASKSNTTSNSNSSTATRTNKQRSASCSVFIWSAQSVIHILQFGQIWR